MSLLNAIICLKGNVYKKLLNVSLLEHRKYVSIFLIFAIHGAERETGNAVEGPHGRTYNIELGSYKVLVFKNPLNKRCKLGGAFVPFFFFAFFFFFFSVFSVQTAINQMTC